MQTKESPHEGGSKPFHTSDSTTSPTEAPDFERIPAELRNRTQWLCWRLEERDGKATKIPYDAKTGKRAKSNDPTTWCDFETATRAAATSGKYAGVGFAFQAGDGLTGLDLDHVINLATGEIDPRALEILQRFQATYCETSPSGTGLRIFAYGKPGRTGKNEGRVKWLEAYNHTSPRYLTVTGNHWSGSATAVTEQQAALDWLHAKYFVKPTRKPQAGARPEPVLSLSDAELLDRARSASNGAKFRALWNGNTTAYGGDDSAADLALCGMLRFWTQGDTGRIDRLFRQSALMRPKWDSRRGDTTYGQMTIETAIAKGGDTYQDRRKGGNGQDTALPGAGSDKPVIDALPGQLHIVVRQAEQALLTADVPIFQQVGVMVRPAILPIAVKVNDFTIPAGTLVIEPVNKAWLAAKMNEVAVWRKWNERKGEMALTDCSPKYAETYIAQKGDWNIRVLTGIVEAPIIRRDGSLLTTPGYDPVSGLWLNYTGLPVSVPDNPTRDDALKALEVLKEPFEEFPFVNGIDLSVALSGVLTAVSRRQLRTAPYHAYDAPVPGAGKSLLVDICSIVATGRVATVSTLGYDETETEKRLGALLMRAVPCINLDNIARSIAGDFLCALATQETVDPRILGQSATATILTSTATLFFTGNNLTIMGDMTRRVLLCRIDPRCERPDAIQFKRNLHEFVPANRHRLLSAALTVLRAFICAGRPAHDKAPYGSFEEWDRLIRGALLWLEQPDPLESRDRIVSNDPEQKQLGALLSSWYAVFSEKKVTTAEVIKAAKVTVTAGEETYDTPGGEALRAALLDVAGLGETIIPKTLGKYLASHKDRVCCNYKLEDAGTYSGRVLWRVRTVSTVSTVSTTQRERFRSENGENGENSDSAKNIDKTEINCSNCSNCSTCAEPPASGDLEGATGATATLGAVTPSTDASDCVEKENSNGATGATATLGAVTPPDFGTSDEGYWQSMPEYQSAATPEPEPVESPGAPDEFRPSREVEGERIDSPTPQPPRQTRKPKPYAGPPDCRACRHFDMDRRTCPHALYQILKPADPPCLGVQFQPKETRS